MGTELLATPPGPVVCRPGAAESALRDCAGALGGPLPEDLADLLRAADGIEGEYGHGLLRPAERIAAENLALRGDPEFATPYMPFEPLLFFGDAGNGDLFAVLAAIDRPDVFVWNHEDDSRTWVAPDLATCLRWRLTGRITG
ncbi:cell wall assembly protein [Streptomyces incarnatus]|uniref:Cell wall assembly protein n=1 Tax=Streptomyces incarnatus TaxID=665007 RepID=A0ABN4GMT8_9ACTN|nr:SMI1/KNR4 family protein [Streptomyces incarnatus]AKJ13128.1 cell wall assembly protein [Streptomyces incarnatus]